MNQELALEALSALTGVTVNDIGDIQGGTARDTEAVGGGIFRATGGSARELTTDNLLSIFGLKSGSLSAEQRSRELFVNKDNLFEPKFNRDFRSGGDSSPCSRGGESYTRPWGWKRYALKVLNKYPDGNDWLGTPGPRNNSSPGEWPVSFHGTTTEGAEGIASSRYKPGPGQAYGRGIYSTPDLKVAESYAKKFNSKGKTYKVIMQNRINPEMRDETSESNYWLIRVPATTSQPKEREIVENSIRPYGILIKQV